MNCHNCGAPNREGANFCARCGVLLLDRCPRCLAARAPDADFCDNCGLALTPHAQFQAWPGAAAPAPAISAPPVPRQQTAPAASAPRAAAPRPAPAGSALQPLQQYIPKELLAKLEAARASGEMVGERRVVTMLFCDVKGSTAAAEQLDPEEWTELINGAFENMIQPVYRYEGTVARLMGDAILAFFGAPIAHEDDPQRAVLAALDIVAGLGPYREQVQRRWGIEFDVRVGINTGLVVVGAVGSDLRMEYSALGDAINLAARMEQTAAPGTVQIAQDTYRLVKPLFDFEELGGIEIKGKAEPVAAYRVVGRKAMAGRMRGIEGLSAALVGREAELAALRAVLGDLERGVGRIVCLLGEAGIGKSRLIAEARGAAPADGVAWHEAASLSYESNQPYGLFQRLLRRMTGIAVDEPASAIREKIGPLLEHFPADRQPRVADVFAALFGLESSGGARLEGETFKRELFDAMRHLWRERFARRPTVLVFDDMHWSDAASVDLLLHLLPLTGETPLVLLCALRPDREAPAWRVKAVADDEHRHRYSELALGSLSAEESDELINRLLAVADLPERLRAGILEKAGGNPFFVEEVVRSLIDSGAVAAEERSLNGQTRLYWRATRQDADFDIPDNLQSLLTARVDRLEEATRATLQMAAVIGRNFYHRVLQAVDEASDELDRRLGMLLRLDMIREAARLPEVEYAFRNPLTQEAVYNTILLKRRREFHRRVAEAMEALFPDRLAEMAVRLAYHFSEARETERAQHYHTLAGDNAFRLYANVEAVNQYARALELARTRPGAASEELAYLYGRHGRAFELNSQHAEALALYEAQERLARDRGDRALELAALVSQGTILATANSQTDPRRAEGMSQQALEIARALGDEAAEAKILWNLLNVYRFDNRVEQALAAGERSLALARKLNLAEQHAFTANDLPFAYLAAGQVARARELLAEASGLWREQGNQAMLADSLSTASTLHAMNGDFDTASALSDEAYQISEAIHNVWGKSYSRFSVGILYWYRGDPDRSIDMMKAALRYGDEAGFMVAQIWSRLHLATAYGNLGHTAPGLELAEEALALSERFNVDYLAGYQGFGWSVLARLRLFDGDLAAAEEAVREADARVDSPVGPMIMVAAQFYEPKVELALAQGRAEEALAVATRLTSIIRAGGIRVQLPASLHMLGKTHLASGQAEAALASLEEARAEAEAIGAHWTLWQVLAALAEVHAVQGNLAQAQARRGQAAQTLQTVVAHIGDEGLRRSFVARPEIRALLGEPA